MSKLRVTSEGSNLDRYRRKKSRIWLVVLGIVALAAIFLLWYGATAFVAFQRATTPNTNGGASALRNRQADAAEPINVLLIGVGGADHAGGTLADSIMIASIDTQAKTISLLSVPRDLYVSIPGDGKDKINAAHSYGESGSKTKGGGPALLKQVITSTLGIPVDYFIRVDFTGFKQIIDTVGGITINVPKAINDPFYPDAQMKGYEPFSISAGVHQLDGKTALKYARSRETTSDFDRARRQQEIIVALRDKVLSAQVLANPKKVTDIITVLGNHVLTDMNAADMEQFVRLASDFGKPVVHSEVLGSSDNDLLTTSRSPIGASIVVPKAGMSDFSDVQLFSRSYIAAPSLLSEHPVIRLARTEGVTKDTLAKIFKRLQWAGITVETDSDARLETTTTLYDLSGGQKVKTLALLKKLYTLVPSTVSSPLPTGSTGDLLLVVGPDYAKALGMTAPTSSGSKAKSETSAYTNSTTSKSGAVVN